MENDGLLIIPTDELKLICKQGEAHYPHECCGFLYGRITAERRELVNAVAIRNEQIINRERRFMISPEQFSRAEREAGERGLELLGFYHSHPDHPAVPSEIDRENAMPFYSYVIVSIEQGRYVELRSWRLDDDRTGYAEEKVVYQSDSRTV